MNKALLISLLVLGSLRAAAQENFNEVIALSRNNINRDGMEVLGGFAIVNIVTGFAIGASTSGATKYFWNMNGYWNLVNLGIATMGYFSALKAMKRQYNLADNERAQLAIEKLYAFNLGLDLVYITGGFYLKERGYSETNQKSREQYNGYGTSVAVQGGFLLLLDATMIAFHHHNSIRLNRKLEGLALTTGPSGVGLSYSF